MHKERTNNKNAQKFLDIEADEDEDSEGERLDKREDAFYQEAQLKRINPKLDLDQMHNRYEQYEQ